MKQILGLDLGVNSIGWALMNSDYSIDNSGTQIFPENTNSLNLERTNQRSLRRLNNRKEIRKYVAVHEMVENNKALIEKLSKSTDIKLDLRFILCLTLIILMLAFACLMKENWQFWINLGIGGIFIVLNMNIKKKN